MSENRPFFGDPDPSGSHPSARCIVSHDPAQSPPMRIAGGQDLLLTAWPQPQAQSRLGLRSGSIS